jgi:hypothetical protein
MESSANTGMQVTGLTHVTRVGNKTERLRILTVPSTV